jgi:hypothetical protein
VQPKQRRTDAPLPDNGMYQCQELLTNSIREVKFIYCFNFYTFHRAVTLNSLFSSLSFTKLDLCD